MGAGLATEGVRLLRRTHADQRGGMVGRARNQLSSGYLPFGGGRLGYGGSFGPIQRVVAAPHAGLIVRARLLFGVRDWGASAPPARAQNVAGFVLIGVGL